MTIACIDDGLVESPKLLKERQDRKRQPDYDHAHSDLADSGPVA